MTWALPWALWHTDCLQAAPGGNTTTAQESHRSLEPMKPTSVAATRSRPNRILVALAAAWMILSLAIGGAVTAETRAESTTTATSGTVAQP